MYIPDITVKTPNTFLKRFVSIFLIYLDEKYEKIVNITAIYKAANIST